MPPQPVTQLFDLTSTGRHNSIKELMRRLGSGRFARAFARPTPEAYADPYVLLLLADQELAEGREEQAISLIEAAYESFDRKTSPQPYKLHLIG